VLFAKQAKDGVRDVASSKDLDTLQFLTLRCRSKHETATSTYLRKLSYVQLFGNIKNKNCNHSAPLKPALSRTGTNKAHKEALICF